MPKIFVSICVGSAFVLTFLCGCDQGTVAPSSAAGAVSGLAPAIPQPSPIPTPAPTPSPAPPHAAEPDPVSQQVFTLTNQFRAANGVAPLNLNDELNTSAQSFAALMLSLDFFAHNSPDGTTPDQRITAAGYTNWTTWGENIAEGYTTAEDVVNGWINSPGHRANMLNAAFKDIGIGYSGGSSPYWVQDFGAR